MRGAGGGYRGGKQRSVSTSRFAMVPRNDVPRSAFDVQHTHKTTFNAGYLVPVYVDEVLPGDSMRVSMTAFCRLATPIVPIMDNLIMESFFFFIPNRLVWSNWARFMGEQASPTDSTTFLMPYQVVDQDVVGSLQDYFGIYTQGNGGTISVNAFPFRGYNLVWNEFFRDQDLQTKVVVDVDDGPDVRTDYVLLRRNKRHDYFTSARPWPEKPMNIDTVSAIAAFPIEYLPGRNFTLPRGTFEYGVGAPVSGLGVFDNQTATAGQAGASTTGSRDVQIGPTHWRSDTDAFLMKGDAAGLAPDVRVMVNDIRTAMMIQRMLEMNARGGTRYTEFVRTQFGVTSPDARLQRPEYLGGGRSMVTINPVAQTSATGATGTTTVLGELAGVGTSVASRHGFSQSFTEHGIIIGMVSMRADMTYQQGINRMWFRRTQFDHYVPGLAHLGEQAIFTKELWAVGAGGTLPNTDDQVFGYQERWSEYKYKPNRVSGAFRSTSLTPLDMWHLGQEYDTQPVLNSTFIQEDPPVARVLQVNTTDSFHFLFDSVFDCRLVRAMPMFSIPGLGPRL